MQNKLKLFAKSTAAYTRLVYKLLLSKVMLAAARQTGLAILSSLKRELGTLNNITAWLRVFSMINVVPDFLQTPSVINGFSDPILEVFGKEIGDHTRSAVGMVELLFGAPVEIEAEVEICT